jgi:hypothetical protein
MNTETSQVVAASVCSIIPDSSTLFAAQLFAGIVEKQLHAESVETLGVGSFCGHDFVVAVARVGEIKPALRAIRAALEICPLNRYPTELAFFDCDEGFWRTVDPVPAPAPFGRFLTDEVLKANQERCDRVTALLEAAIKKAQ